MEVQPASSIEVLEKRFVERPTTVRYYVLLGLCLVVADAYLTRVMSAASTTIQNEFSLANEEIGNVLAGFALGYFFFQADQPLPPTSPHLRDHQRWQGEVCWDWLCERRGWPRSDLGR